METPAHQSDDEAAREVSPRYRIQAIERRNA